MVYITAVHMEGGERHEHIASVRWSNPADGKSDVSTRATMVDWIKKGGDARVTDGRNEVQVGVVDANPPYLRTFADGKPTDNLLALPRF
ncbi:conserved hypothetical protein [Anaeromyxobacter dehalogenans 2CP-1]|uniref:DUF3892 domain-containing protein n=1 Tax=Anaeromyxobacter dehalogenans (strain ATCC BAA-258 / DSM 21875 / 2CP-1) TaxID=455488 RepID=B8JGJ2_ANAD2|nr:DUF3892 domain-containing protein [Anaeromyxobacter dehalogenans]ACL64663.1 conserved hypothetical protein [Anaeromyxobacter dehalogenans 2CP-1]